MYFFSVKELYISVWNHPFTLKFTQWCRLSNEHSNQALGLSNNSSAIYSQCDRIPAIQTTSSVLCHLILPPLTYCSVTIPYAVFHITADNEVQHLIQLYSASISIHVVLRSATVEAGNSPALGVTFRQPQFILNVIDLHVGEKKLDSMKIPWVNSIFSQWLISKYETQCFIICRNLLCIFSMELILHLYTYKLLNVVFEFVTAIDVKRFIYYINDRVLLL